VRRVREYLVSFMPEDVLVMFTRDWDYGLSATEVDLRKQFNCQCCVSQSKGGPIISQVLNSYLPLDERLFGDNIRNKQTNK